MHSTAYTFHIPTQTKNKAFTIIRQHGKTPAELNAIAETWINDTRARLVSAEKTRRGEA